MRPSPPSHPSAQQSPHSQPPSHGQILSNQVCTIYKLVYLYVTYMRMKIIQNKFYKLLKYLILEYLFS